MTRQDKQKIAIIDYQMGNLFSVQNACRHVGLESVITNDLKEILTFNAAILPGVGAFGDAIGNLRRLDLIEPIKDFISAGKFFMGICLGFQLLFTESEEFGTHMGLGVLPGRVVKFSVQNANGVKVKVPQVGWNQIHRFKGSKMKWKQTPLKSAEGGDYMYFVHSFFACPEKKGCILTVTEYEGFQYCSSVATKTLFAYQFHPEKSGVKGLEIYKNFKNMILEKEYGSA